MATTSRNTITRLVLLGLTIFAPTTLAQAPHENIVLDKAFRYERTHHITQIRDECLLYMFNPEYRGVYLVDVKEDHRKGCGGDPETEPRVMTLRINLKTGKIDNDYSDPGKYYYIRKPTVTENRK